MAGKVMGKPKGPKRTKPRKGEHDFLADWKRLNPKPPQLPEDKVRPPKSK